MNQRLLCLLIAILGSTLCFSQDTTSTDVTDVLRVTLYRPGVSYEKKIGHLQTLYGHTSLSTRGAWGYSSTLGTTSSFYIDPSLTFNYRYYYNTAQRLEKGKRTELNSLNYVGALYDFLYSRMPLSSDYVEENNRRTVHTFGAIWGLQRNYKSHLSIDFNVGLGYYFSKGTKLNKITGARETGDIATATGVGNFTLGFWLNRK